MRVVREVAMRVVWEVAMIGEVAMRGGGRSGRSCLSRWITTEKEGKVPPRSYI